ncbi:MAG: hypothetical protein KC435_13735 [Thermomicrobiales bacterium]|nr:hypothetical protein [Thermomicrobiales bacterium]
MESRSRLSNALQGNRVPELEALGYEPVLSRDGRVEVVSGMAANVACVRDASGRKIAVRVAREVSTGIFWQRHYGSMEDGLPRSARSYFPARIQPLTGGITIVGRKMPTVLEEWIDGPTLMQAIDKAAIARNSAVLDALAGALQDLSIALRDSRITHGDLTPTNLMLRPNGDIVCVDLDTLEWPGARKRVHDAPEHAYRHPGRSGTPAHQDAFAILVMFVSIVILRETPQLQPNSDHDLSAPDAPLLFNVWDLRQSRDSEMVAFVRDHTTPLGRNLLEILERACEAEAFRAQEMLDQAFDLAHIARAVRGQDESAPTWEPPSETPEELDIGAAVARLRELYGQSAVEPTRPSFNFAETWPEPVETPDPIVPSVPNIWEDEVISTAPVPEVVRRPIERIARRNQRQLAQVLEDEARAARELDREINRAAQQQDDALVLSLAQAAGREQLVLEETTRRTIRQAQERDDIRKRLARALETNNRRDLADLAVSGELALLGDTKRESLLKVLQALEWPGLLRALETDDDTLIMLWFDEEVFEDIKALPSAMRMRIDLARNRLQWQDEVRAKLRDHDAEALELLVANEPEGGRQRLGSSERRRIGELIDRRRAVRELELALRAGNNPRIISALAIVDQTGATIDDPQLWSQVQQIVRRSEVIQAAIHAASKNPPDDRSLAAIVPRLREMGIAHDHALRGEYGIDRLQAIIVRGAAVRRIRRAIAQDDDRAIRLAASPDTTGALKLLTPAERERVDIARARKRVKRIDV